MLLSVIGDEDLYGKDYVVEPYTCSFWNSNPAYIGDRTIIVNNNVYGSGIVYVANWPIIGLCSPSFSIYVLPGGIIRYWNRGDQFYITTIGLIIITIIVIAIVGRLYVFLRITLIIWGEGLLQQLWLE
jgi:hypothetical protein